MAAAQPKRSREGDASDVPIEQTPVSREELDDILGALQADVTSAVTAAVSQSFTIAIRKMDERAEKRYSELEAEVRACQQKDRELEEQQTSLWAAIKHLQRDLLSAEQSVPVRDALVDDSFDRKIDVTIIKVSSKELVDKDAVFNKVSGLSAEADIGQEHFKVNGDNVAKKFTVQFTGPAQTAERRVEKVLTLLRQGNGAWRQIFAVSPARRETQLFFGPDKSGKQIKTEMESKRLHQAFKDVHSDLNPFLLRKEGIISISWVPVARVEVFPKGQSTVVHWNSAVVERHGIDKNRLIAAFRLSERASEPVVWERHHHQL